MLQNNNRQPILNKDSGVEIPDNWTWARLTDIASDDELNDGNWVLSKDMVSDGEVKLIQLGNIGDCEYRDKGYKFLTREHFEELNGRQIFPGYLLVNRLVQDRMKACIIPKISGILMTAVDVCWIAPSENYDIKYLMYALTSSFFQKKVQQLGGGTTRFRISKTNLINICFPFPPVEEQSRIVEAIDATMRMVISVDKLQQQYTNNITSLSKKILDLAVRGKLVPQDPNDEPASVLLKKIAEEKLKLIKEGKIKKQKALPAITEDEIPFEIPESWEWVRLNECLDVRDGTHDTPKYYTEGYPLVTSKNLRDGEIDFSTCKLICKEDYEAINQRSKVDDGDILFAMIGTVGNPVLYRGTSDFSIKNMALFKHIGDLLDMEYVYWFFRFAQQDMKNQASGGVQSFVSLSFLRSYLIPIPPRNEQRRIVNSLTKILPLMTGMLVK